MNPMNTRLDLDYKILPETSAKVVINKVWDRKVYMEKLKMEEKKLHR